MEIENRVADTILQKPYKVEVGGVTYEVAPPSIATLVIVSSLVAKLPQVNLNEKNILLETLKVAKDCSLLGDIVATLILGADNLEEEKVIVQKRCFGIIREEVKIKIDNQHILSDKILKKLTPRQVNNTTIEILNRMEVGDFFGLTASLIEVNLTKPTKQVGIAEMTVSGQ
jgi:hypothetical protein